MAKTASIKANENEPLNKKLKTSRSNEQNKDLKNVETSQSNRQADKSNEQQKRSKKSKKNQVDKSLKLEAKGEQVKSDELRTQRQMRRQKKKLDRLNKNKKSNQQKKNQHLNTEQKLSVIFHQQNVHHKTIINHYENLAAKVNADNVVGFIKQIKDLLLDENLTSQLKNHLINSLYKFVNILHNQQNNETLIMLVNFCALNSFFSTRTDDNVVKNMDQKTINFFRNCFFKTITLIIRNCTNKKLKKIENSKLDLLYQITKNIYTLINSEDSDRKVNYNAIFKKISNSYKQIQLKDENKNEQSTLAAFFMFYVFLSINLFEENCMQIVDEVNECFKRFNSNKQTDDDPHWADVFTDIVLSLLSTANHLKRAICDEVFALISKEITSDGLDQLMNALLSDNIEVINNEESDIEDEEEFMDAREELTDEDVKDDASDSEAEEDEENEELNSDVELEQDEDEIMNDLEVDENCAIEKINIDESESESSDESGVEESDDEESDTASIDSEFRRKIKDALGKAAVEDESEDEIIYDDEQMLEFDEAISKVFQEKKKIANKSQELIEFKSRCFDLVHTMLNTKDIDFLIQIAKSTLEVLSKNNTAKSYDLILKASTVLKKYQTIEFSKLNVNNEKTNELQELLKLSLRLLHRLPEKVRNNLNYFIVWLLDLCKLNDTTELEQLILDNIDKKLKKSSEISLLIQLAERKKHFAKLIFDRLIKIDTTNKLTNFEIYSFHKLIIACLVNLDRSIVEANKRDIINVLNRSVEIINQKKNEMRAKFIVEEAIRFLSLFIKSNLELVKNSTDLTEKIANLNNQSNRFKLSKKLRQKWNFTLRQLQ